MEKRFFLAALFTLLCGFSAGAENLPPFSPASPDAADLSKLVLQDLDGNSASFEKWRGKVLLVNFASTWCAPCYAEMPALNRLHDSHSPKGLAVVTVIVHNGGAAKAKKFCEKAGTRFPVLIEEGSDVMSLLGVSELPVSYILDRAGKPVAKIIGAAAWDSPEAVEYFEGLLKR